MNMWLVAIRRRTLVSVGKPRSHFGVKKIESWAVILDLERPVLVDRHGNRSCCSMKEKVKRIAQEFENEMHPAQRTDAADVHARTSTNCISIANQLDVIVALLPHGNQYASHKDVTNAQTSN